MWNKFPALREDRCFPGFWSKLRLCPSGTDSYSMYLPSVEHKVRICYEVENNSDQDPVYEEMGTRMHSIFLAILKSLYDILGVTPKAEMGVIKSAFYDLSKQHHPDVNVGKSDEKFRELAAAYEVLSNLESRQEYDQDRKQGQTQERQQYPGKSEPKGDPRDSRAGDAHHSRYGVHPDFGRSVDVDMSPERMAKAWEAYKIRWEHDEGRKQELEELKLNFRMNLDKQREERYSKMTFEEREELKEDMRILRMGRKAREAKKDASRAKTHRIEFEQAKPGPPSDRDPLGFKSWDCKIDYEVHIKEMEETLKTIKTNYDQSNFLSHQTGSSQSSGEFRSFGSRISRKLLFVIVAFGFGLMGFERGMDSGWISHDIFYDKSHQKPPKSD
eukprot:maker-scaffold388_size188554-snap-gene-0.18 protein:Tk06210 transcript:maker-scaffold388_size188554-snap-gene-0.18-mRNA-1 annotation:"chaperone protein dnaj"